MRSVVDNTFTETSMPLSADPAATAAFKFETFDQQSFSFKARFLSRKAASRHDEVCAEIHGKFPDDPEVRAKVREAIELGIVGWDRADPYTFDALAEVMTDRDLAILAVNYTTAVQLAEIDLGKSRSRLAYVPESSAATASGDASTSPL